jgi:hypothetical protein
MKYVEELIIGETFKFKNSLYILTPDFKKSGLRMAICLSSGYPIWLESDWVVEPESILNSNHVKIQNINTVNSTKDIS